LDSSLVSYLLRRLLWVPLILFVVSFVTFALARFGPGDPVSVAAGQFRDPEVLDRIRHARGLDKPFYEQYWIYVKNAARGDLGESYRYKDRKVTEVIFPAIWRSFQLNSVALVITLGLGIPLGVFAARRQGTWADPASIGSFLLIQSIPGLILVPFLLLAFALKLGWLPASGWPRDCSVAIGLLGESYKCIGIAHTYYEIPISWRFLVPVDFAIPVIGMSREVMIPIIALSLPAVASWARYTRAFTLGVLREDYVRTARAKGVSETTVMTRHVLRNALLPLSTLVAFAMVGLLEGSFFVETLTGIPGVGRLAFESIGSRDYDMIMAITLLGSSSFVLASIFIDVAYTFIDPRIRYGA